MRLVVRVQEEWRTKGGGRGGDARSHGRACLWLTLECGHHEQRMARVDRNGAVSPPKKVRCWDCGEVHQPAR